jgi:SAM-dependent methyltransferase
MTADHFAGRVAEHYDEASAEAFDPAVVDPAVDLLADLAGDGAALEFGIGTGRLALPLRARGVPVHGIDLSPDMLARLRAKPGGESIPVTVGDFGSATVDGTFALVYLVFNTVMNLTTQDEQVACFANAARHLAPGGHFVVEVGVPDLRRLPPGERARAYRLTETHVDLDEYDVAAQRMVSHHYTVTDGRLDVVSIPFRYVWPAELDLMARLAGLVPAARWEDWHRRPFTDESRAHVSAWRTPG